MDLTTSFLGVLPEDVIRRYQFAETRNAATILFSTNRNAFNEMVTVLRDFTLMTSDLVTAGGQESELAARLNHGFRGQGWREARVDTQTGVCA